MFGLVSGRVGPRRVFGVRQCQITRAQFMQHAQHRQRVAQRMAALDADERRNPAHAMNPFDVIGGAGQFKRVRVIFDQAMHQIGLFQSHFHGRGGGKLRRHIDGPELRAHPAGPQPRDIRRPRLGQLMRALAQIHGGKIVVLFMELPGQIVVAVNQRHCAQHFADERQVAGLGRRRRRGIVGGGGNGQAHKRDPSCRKTTGFGQGNRPHGIHVEK
ncbi:MAG: hypothetical protein BWX84_02427 [Verrucomicrobia bacterium ADurb.Bin118]|nr:MAG: hypothetical protein BWX84_02427 [Verrucomicrobia bacterium ADurb.Bin118]